MNFLVWCCSISVCLLVSACASVTGFEEARTISKGKHELNPSGNMVYMADYFGEDDDEVYFKVELKYRYGKGEKVDLEIRLSYSMNLEFFPKFNILNS